MMCAYPKEEMKKLTLRLAGREAATDVFVWLKIQQYSGTVVKHTSAFCLHRSSRLLEIEAHSTT